VCQRFRTTGQEATTSTARRIHGSTIACVLLAFAMTTAATAKPLQDHRSPDARDAAQTPGMSETTSAPPQDLRSRTGATPRRVRASSTVRVAPAADEQRERRSRPPLFDERRSLGASPASVARCSLGRRMKVIHE
jgi:hypothetical protein